MTVEPLVRATELTKRFGPVTALDALTVDIPHGRTGLVGANGAGTQYMLNEEHNGLYVLLDLGRGACESLVDAATLADLLNTLPMEQALKAYDRQRRLRTRALSLASSALARVALAEGAPAAA